MKRYIVLVCAALVMVIGWALVGQTQQPGQFPPPGASVPPPGRVPPPAPVIIPPAGEFPPPGAATAPEMPLLRGDLWRKMTYDEKVAFVWGIGHVATLERIISQKHPEMQNQGFADKLAEGLQGVPMDTVIQRVDQFYQANPGQVNEPAMRVIWDTSVKPGLKAGIGGRPLR